MLLNFPGSYKNLQQCVALLEFSTLLAQSIQYILNLSFLEREKTHQTNAKQKGMSWSEQELKAFASFLALNESRDQQWATTLETVAKKQ